VQTTEVNEKRPYDLEVWCTFVDETDIRILKELMADARVSYKELARRIGVSVGTTN